jgi:DNA polymerase-4
MAQISPTLARLCEMVGRRLREHGLHARTVQLKLRYSDFSTITRAHSIARPTQLDTELHDEIRELFRRNWKAGSAVRLLGVHASGWADGEEQLDLIDEGRHEKWKQALAAADRMRDRFGESAVSLAAGLRGNFRERTHENPTALPGKKK